MPRYERSANQKRDYDSIGGPLKKRRYLTPKQTAAALRDLERSSAGELYIPPVNYTDPIKGREPVYVDEKGRIRKGCDPNKRTKSTIGLDKYGQIVGGECTGFRDKEGNLVTKALSILGIFIGLFFFSPNLTGNAILDFSKNSSNCIGLILIMIGIITAYFWFRNKK